MSKEIAELQARYKALTGESEDYKAGKKRKAPSQDTDPMTPPPDASTFEPWAPRSHFRFEVLHESKNQDRGRGSAASTRLMERLTLHAFVPVGTNGALKAVSSEQANDADVQLMFCNTYHLLVHPGTEVVQHAGGLHKFMRRDRPLITDSGGFQVFSLADADSDDDGPELKQKRVRTEERCSRDAARQIVQCNTEQGVVFKSYRDGAVIELTPESSVQAQKKFGADIIIPLDELPPYHVTRDRLEKSVQLSHRWMARSSARAFVECEQSSHVRRRAWWCG